MKKIDNFENIKESTGFKRLPTGGYIAKILSVEDVPDKQYLRIAFDIDDGEYKGFYKAEYDADTRAEKRWPSAGFYIRSYKDSALSMFKGFTTAVEKSNKGYTWDFDENSLKGKLVGIVVGEEEYLSNKGAVRVKSKVVDVRSVQTIVDGEYTVPPLKKLDESQRPREETPVNMSDIFGDSSSSSTTPANKSMEKPNNIFGDDDDLPF